MIDDPILAGLEPMLAASGLGPVTVTVDAELTAGANRRTVLLTVSPRDGGSGEPFRAVAQISERDDERVETTRSVVDEGAVVTLAGVAGVPVAPVLAAAPLDGPEPVDVLITGHVAGETIPRRVLRSVGVHDGGGSTLTRACGHALARLHSIDPAVVVTTGRALPAFTAPAYLDHLTERLDDLPDRHPTFRFAVEMLRRHLPSEPPTARLVHGDFRNGNLLVAGADLAAVLDWELVHLGDPMEDLAWLCLRTWRFGVDDNEVGGFGGLHELRRAYTDAGGRWRQDAFDWWTMARTAWWGIGLAGQAAAYQDGRSRSLVHAASGRRVVELEYDLLGLLTSRIR